MTGGLIRYRFFGGKGGTGKTTCAAAAALRRAESGHRLLLVSTDPAHSLGDVLGLPLGAEPVRVPTRRGELLAVELDAPAALARWLAERRDDLETLAERGTWLDRDDVHRLLDLSLPGADELVGLLELVRLAETYQEVVVDTAPTGHTLRLLAMPDELRHLAEALDRLQTRHRIVAESLGGAWRPDRSDALLTEIEQQGREIGNLLRDPERTTFHWVLLPEALSVAETRDGVHALEAAGIEIAELIVNRVNRVNRMTPPGGPCAHCDARRQAEAEALGELRAAFPDRSIRFLPELEREPRGLAAIRRIGVGVPFKVPSPRSKRPPSQERASPSPIQEKVTKLRLLLVGGKGGVGKTTCASSLALRLAASRPDDRVLLLSTDPAHSLADALEVPLGDDERSIPGAPPNLRAREIDAVHTFADWRARHLEEVEGWLEEAGGAAEQAAWRDLLDLAPPGLDELSAVSALLDALPVYDQVIVDTAPTGHTLRLLETPAALLTWVQLLLSLLLKYREVAGLGLLAATLVELSRDLRHLGELMRDPARTGFFVVTRAAELPRRETVRLLAELARLGLSVPALIVDAVVDGVASPGCPRCARQARAQDREIRHLRRSAGRSCAIIRAPAVFPPPRGAQALAAWGQRWETETP